MTEGTPARFTVTARPAPRSNLTVNLTVADAPGSDFVTTGNEGAQTVTINANASSSTYTVATQADSNDEPNGPVTVTVNNGSGYTVGSTSSAAVTVNDNDDSQKKTEKKTTPAIRISGGGTVTEGTAARFTVTARPAPRSNLTVNLTVADAPGSDFVTTGNEGAQTVTINANASSSTYAVATQADSNDEPNGPVTVTVNNGSGYTVGSTSSAAVTVSDDDTTDQAPGTKGSSISQDGTIQDPDDTTGPEFVSTQFVFMQPENQVELAQVQTSGGQVAVVQATGVGVTYSLAGGGQGRFAVAPVSGVVTTVGAATPPGTYALTVQATDARGRTATAPVVIEVVSVVGQRLTRVRRTVLPEAARLATGSAFAAVSDRLGAARTATRLRVAGYDLTGAAPPQTAARAQDPASTPPERTRPRAPATLDLSQVLAGSTFTLPLAATGEENGGLRPVLWGTVDWNALTGSGTAPDWDGEMLHAQLGADLQVTEHLLAGLALSHDRGTFDWTDASAATGTLSSHLTSLLPYLGWTLHDRVALWAAASLGRGEVSLEDTEAGTFDSPATAWSTGVGVRGALLPAGPTALALKAEAWLAQWTAAATGPMAALDTDVQRLRLALEGQRAWRWADGAALTPALALGVRHDGGEGETGTGLELGGGVQWHDPGRGLTLRAQARTLLGRGEYRQWGAGGVVRLDPGADGRGLTLSLAPTWGAAASGGVARLWEEGLTGRPAVGRGPAPQLTAAVGYGLAAPGTPGTVTPYAGLALAGGQAQTWRTGLRLAVNTGLDAHLETTRREQPGGPPVHGVTLQTRLRF